MTLRKLIFFHHPNRTQCFQLERLAMWPRMSRETTTKKFFIDTFAICFYIWQKGSHSVLVNSCWAVPHGQRLNIWTYIDILNGLMCDVRHGSFSSCTTQTIQTIDFPHLDLCCEHFALSCESHSGLPTTPALSLSECRPLLPLPLYSENGLIYVNKSVNEWIH